MYNPAQHINIKIRHDGALTQIEVRWPTDEEWVQNKRQKPTNVRILGRGRTEQEQESAEPDAKLYEAIKMNGAPPLSPAEAKAIIDELSRCDVQNVELGNDTGVVEMHTIAGLLRHTLKIPTMDQIREYQATTHVTGLPHNRYQIRSSIEGAARLYDRCNPVTEGYGETQPPILHKDVAIRMLIQAVEQEMAQGHDENF